MTQLALEIERVEQLLSLENKLHAAGINYLAGVDEAGRGPLAGPVVAAAVIFPQDVYITGINDSKLLSPSRREELYKRIFVESESIGVGQSSPQEIDQINILQASLLAMKRALENLTAMPDYVLIDGLHVIPDYPVHQEALVKGDRRSFSVAAASIIAKVERDRLMMNYHQAYPEYGFDRHKGYPSKAHRTAIKMHGYCDIHRRSFKVTL